MPCQVPWYGELTGVPAWRYWAIKDRGKENTCEFWFGTFTRFHFRILQIYQPIGKTKRYSIFRLRSRINGCEIRTSLNWPEIFCCFCFVLLCSVLCSHGICENSSSCTFPHFLHTFKHTSSQTQFEIMFIYIIVFFLITYLTLLWLDKSILPNTRRHVLGSLFLCTCLFQNILLENFSCLSLLFVYFCLLSDQNSYSCGDPYNLRKKFPGHIYHIRNFRCLELKTFNLYTHDTNTLIDQSIPGTYRHCRTNSCMFYGH